MKLDAKSLEVLLKRGCGTEEIATEINVEPEELVSLIQKIFSEPAAKNYCRRLAKNDKHHKATQPVVVVTEVQEDVNMPQDVVETHETAIVAPQEENVVSLQALREKEATLQILTAEQEVVVKTTVQDYRAVLDDLSSKSNLLVSLRNQIVQLKADIESLEERAITVLESHGNDLDKLHELQQDLYQVRCEIAKRAVINVFVYVDGTITLEKEGETIETNFEGWEDAKHILEDRFEDIINDLPLKYVKQLAKLMCLPPLEEGNRYDLSFDVPDVETAYTLIKEA